MVDGLEHLWDVAPFTLGALYVTVNNGQACFVVLRYCLAGPKEERVKRKSLGVPLGGGDQIKRVDDIGLCVKYLEGIDW